MRKQVPSRSQFRASRQRGFTLLELAVVVGIVALLIGILVVPLVTQTRERRIAETQRVLEEIKQAMIGYAIAQQPGPVLPCPDKTAALPAGGTENDGIEDRDANNNCIVIDGNVPWVTLGVPRSDVWGTRYRYRVNRNYSDRNSPTPPWQSITLSTSSDLWVCTNAPNDVTASPCAPGAPVTAVPSAPIPASWRDAVAAVILSHGENTWGGVNEILGTVRAAPPGSPARPDEDENAGLDARVFVMRDPAPTGTARGEFDDIVTWISPHVLKSRMVAAGRLP